MLYRDYLKTDYWKERRAEFKKHTKNRCWLCHSRDNLQVHHKRYERKGRSILFQERHADLRLLCGRCHKQIHDKGLMKIFAQGCLKRKMIRDFILGKSKYSFNDLKLLNTNCLERNGAAGRRGIAKLKIINQTRPRIIINDKPPELKHKSNYWADIGWVGIHRD